MDCNIVHKIVFNITNELLHIYIVFNTVHGFSIIQILQGYNITIE